MGTGPLHTLNSFTGLCLSIPKPRAADVQSVEAHGPLLSAVMNHKEAEVVRTPQLGTKPLFHSSRQNIGPSRVKCQSILGTDRMAERGKLESSQSPAKRKPSPRGLRRGSVSSYLLRDEQGGTTQTGERGVPNQMGVGSANGLWP